MEEKITIEELIEQSRMFDIPVKIIHGADKITLVVSTAGTLNDAVGQLGAVYLGTTLMEEINECVAFTTEVYTNNHSKYIGICIDLSKIDIKRELVNTVIHETTHAVLKMYDYIGANFTDNTESYTEFYAYPIGSCLLYTSPSPRDRQKSRMPSSA